MFEKFYPNEYYESTYVIDFQRKYNMGYRGIVFDIDNTLVPHGAMADERSINLFKKLKEIGFKCCLISNNDKERVEGFNKDVNVNFVYKANKPSVKAYKKAMKIMGTTLENTFFVGDQLFTDIYGANRTGMYAVLVKQIDKKEEIQIVLKRKLEKIVLHFYKKKRNQVIS